MLSIAWGVFFLSKDFAGQRIGSDIFASAFYFLLPSMLLIIFYHPLLGWIKVLTLCAIIPSLVELIILKTESGLAYETVVRKVGYQLIHLVNIVWGSFFYLQYCQELKRHLQPK